jgi:catechol 2,3-dioxygenase-like lactoylglutathione lyase family enzyme
MSILGIHHATLNVADLAAAVRFYGDAAGLRASTQGLSAWPDSVLMQGPNAALQLRQARGAAPAAARPVSQAGITHVCLQSPSMPWLHGRFAAAGAGFHAPPVNLGTGFLYCYARDPEGNVIELEGVAPVWDEPAPWLAHVSISTANLERLRDFYAAVFGHPATTSPRLGPQRRLDAISGLHGTQFQMAWVAAGNLQIELIRYDTPATLPAAEPPDAQAPGYGHIALEVSDIGTARAHLLACGAVLDDTLSGAHHAHLRDPDGNRLLLLELVGEDAALAIAALPQPQIVQALAERRAALAQTPSLSQGAA